MHKDFYVSGFLFHSPTQQILLRQLKNSNGSPAEWLVFGSKSEKGETPEDAFARAVKTVLSPSPKMGKIIPVYTYVNDATNRTQHIFFAEIEVLEDFSSEEFNFGWFTFKQAYKLPLEKQTKHNITVTQRVVDSATRKSLGQQTLE